MERQFKPESAAADILHLLEVVIQRFDQNDNAVSRYDSERGDLDHMIELHTFNAAEGYQLAQRIKENRSRRRQCKDENHLLEPLYNLIRQNGDKLLKDFRLTAKTTEKEARYLQNRQYNPRTGIISKEEFDRKRGRST